MRKIQEKRWPRVWRAVSIIVVGGWLLTAYQGVAGAADASAGATPVATTGAAATSKVESVPHHDHALPKITMWEKSPDTSCSFSLYDGQQINFKDSSACPNDEHYFFSISGAHEGMWLEIQNNPYCGYNESYAFYKVSFQDQQTGEIGKTEVQLSQGKAVGTRLIDGNGEPYLLADGWRGGSNLQGAVSCVKVGQLLPDGPFRYRSAYYTSQLRCLRGPDVDGGQWGLPVCDNADGRQSYFSTLNQQTYIYAGWIPRTKGFAPYLASDDIRLRLATPNWNPGPAVVFTYDESTQQMKANGRCAYIIPNAPDVYVGECLNSSTYKWIRERVGGKSQ